VKLNACIIALLEYSQQRWAQEVRRPPITGFFRMLAFSSSSPVASKAVLCRPVGPGACERPGLYIVGGQSIEPKRGEPAHSALASFPTSPLPTPDAEGMRRYLEARGVQVPAKTNHESNGTRWFALGRS